MSADIEQQHEQLLAKGGGASIVQNGHDPRFSKFLAWGVGFLGTAFVLGVFTLANNLYNLNMNVAKLVANSAATSAQIADHESRIRAVERDVSAIEGKVFRGGFDPLKEPVRGH